MSFPRSIVSLITRPAASGVSTRLLFLDAFYHRSLINNKWMRRPWKLKASNFFILIDFGLSCYSLKAFCDQNIFLYSFII